jgi:hypothetical protein
MGYAMIAHFDVDQVVMDEIVDRDNHDWDAIAQCYKDIFIPDDIQLHYEYGKNDQYHQVYSIYPTNSIRDDERFANPRHIKLLEKEVGKPFPQCLTSINTSLHTAGDALEIAEGLYTFFPEDRLLLHFADWLHLTSKYASTYELRR